MSVGIQVGDTFYLRKILEGESNLPFFAEWLYSDGTAYVKQHGPPFGYGSVHPDEIGDIFVGGVGVIPECLEWTSTIFV